MYDSSFGYGPPLGLTGADNPAGDTPGAEVSGASGAEVPDTAALDPIGTVLSAVTGQLGRAVDVPVWTLDDDRLQARLTQALQAKAGVDELIARLVGEIDDRDLATKTGASSTRSYLAATHRMSTGQAAGIVAQARAMTPRTDITRGAWATGRISGEQAVVIGKALAMLDADIDASTMGLAQLHLIESAEQLNYLQLRHVANHLVEVVDPAAAEAKLGEQLRAEEDRALQATVFRGRPGLDGIARFSGRLPNSTFAMLSKAIEACAAPRRKPANPPGTPLGATAHGPGTSDVIDVDGAHCDTETGVLTYGQRLGRAFAELIEHLPVDKLPQHGVANAQIVVTIDAKTLATGIGEATLDTGGVISASEARRLACNAGLLPVVLDGPSKILDLGMSQRLFDRYQRTALAVRDKGCVWPACDRPPAWCEAHHINPWHLGGPTDITNGCLLCPFHHRLLDTGEWAVVMAPDGIPELIPPERIDPHRRPIRHQRLKPRAG